MASAQFPWPGPILSTSGLIDNSSTITCRGGLPLYVPITPPSQPPPSLAPAATSSLAQLYRVGSGIVGFVGYTYSSQQGDQGGGWQPPPGSGQLLTALLQLPDAQAMPPLGKIKNSWLHTWLHTWSPSMNEDRICPHSETLNGTFLLFYDPFDALTLLHVPLK